MNERIVQLAARRQNESTEIKRENQRWRGDPIVRVSKLTDVATEDEGFEPVEKNKHLVLETDNSGEVC